MTGVYQMLTFTGPGILFNCAQRQADVNAILEGLRDICPLGAITVVQNRARQGTTIYERSSLVGWSKVYQTDVWGYENRPANDSTRR